MMTNVAIIGEQCVDEYVYGTCDRICPEASALCFSHKNEKTSNNGMAANVHANLLKLDEYKKELDVSLICSKAPIIKRRFIDRKYNTILFREDINDSCERITIDHSLLNKFSYIILSDYNKGFLEEEDIISICEQHKHHAVIFIDTKKNPRSIAKYVNFIKINNSEFSLLNQQNFNDIQNQTPIIVTKGDLGATLYHANTQTDFPTEKIILKDASGAGDTFLAALVYMYIKNKNINDCISFANRCSSIVVSKFGVTTV